MNFSFQSNREADTFTELPQDVVFQVTSFLPIESLLSIKSVNKQFFGICGKDEAGWESLCIQLWKNKIFVDESLQKSPYIDAYRQTTAEAKSRQYIHRHEFCFDPVTEEGTIWNFRFKDAAGPDWTSWDPWWNGKEPRQMIFLPDGKVQSYLSRGQDQSDVVGNPQVFGHTLRNGAIRMDIPVSMTWRFSAQPMDFPKRPVGSYIRISVGGRDVPTYVIRRSPTSNWGFIAESCWGVYTSFKMPKKIQHEQGCESGDGDTIFMNDAGQQGPSQTRTEGDILEDSSTFLVTNEVQWREALLYNFGAMTLPEGDNATDDFNRMFGQTMQNRPRAPVQAEDLVEPVPVTTNHNRDNDNNNEP